MIHKTLHYIWLGGDKPELIKQCISSWKRYLKDYEITEWNESNIDISNYDPILKQFWEESYTNKKYAFCSDITRLYIMRDNGGVYVDTDVEFIKPLSDSFLDTPFLCRNNPTQEINNGCIWADIKDSKLASACIRWFAERLQTRKESYGTGWIFNRILDSYFIMFGYDRHIKDTQDVVGYKIYPTDFFCPMNIMNKGLYKTENTISIHHYMKSWKPQNINKG